MKAQKIITLITVILLVVIISFASFVGIYKKKDYKVVNVVPKYTLGMQFNNSRKVTFTVDDSTKTKILDSEEEEAESQKGNAVKDFLMKPVDTPRTKSDSWWNSMMDKWDNRNNK